MRTSTRLWQQLRLTLFSSPTCSLCDTAKSVVATVQTRRAFEFRQVNIHDAGQERWRDVYSFDTPVLHVETVEASEAGTVVPAAQKLMHRFSVNQVEATMQRLE